ncbi:MAG TPA: hypothetical protein VFT12_03470 [Thermoanaerobaculia bacterium]|nr:hypothetical protein [Thermoanaerobaculia bacterium]
MNKWAVRVAGLIMLLMFLLLFAHLQQQLVRMQRQNNPPAQIPR